MDKYTYSIKAEKIQKLVKKGEYEAAVKIADTVDWEEVHSVRLLTITASAYENLKDYKSAIELLQMAYEESAVGKRILYKLTGLAIADGDVNLAQHYYEMYLQEASDDNGRYLLRYLLAELKQEPLDKRIAILETYRKYEFEEEWALRLAQMYDEAGMSEECVKLCDEIILWFGVGDYVDEAMNLKEKYAPLSAEQQEHRDNKEFYEQRYQEIVDEYKDREAVLDQEEEAEELPPAAEAWADQILLLEAESLEEAVPKTLEKLALYYKAKNENIGKLTRISAERFNQVGFEAAREHTKGKDLLIDEASALSEELLSDIVHSLKYENNPQVYILADKPEQLAYLDARLGEFKLQESTIPQIAVSELQAEEVLPDVAAAMDGEIKESADAGEQKETVQKEEAPQETAAPETAPEPEEKKNVSTPSAQELAQQDAEQISFSFDEPQKEEEAETLIPPKKAEETAEEQTLQAAGEELSELDHQLSQLDKELAALSAVAPAGQKREEPVEPKQEEPAAPKQAEPAEIKQGVPAVTKQEEPAEPKQEEPAELKEENENTWNFGSFFEEKAESSGGQTESVKETKKVPIEEIRQALREQQSAPAKAEEVPAAAPVPVGSTQVVSGIRKKVGEMEKETEAPSGETKTVPKVSMATGKIGAIGMSEEAFIAYAKNYINSIDCVLDEAGDLALQNAAEARKEKGMLLTKEVAENMIEDAADRAERKGGLFAKRYNKEGCLILRSKYIE